MAPNPANQSGPGRFLPDLSAKAEKKGGRGTKRIFALALLALAVWVAPMIFAQVNAQVTAVDPASGKVNDSVTLTGAGLGKGSVSAVYLSDDKDDFKATIVDQSDDKIVMKIPQVKSGSYNISVQVGDKILIKPVRFTVEQ